MMTTRVREHEQRVGHRDRLRRRRGQPLDQPHDVVAKKPTAPLQNVPSSGTSTGVRARIERVEIVQRIRRLPRTVPAHDRGSSPRRRRRAAARRRAARCPGRCSATTSRCRRAPTRAGTRRDPRAAWRTPSPACRCPAGSRATPARRDCGRARRRNSSKLIVLRVRVRARLSGVWAPATFPGCIACSSRLSPRVVRWWRSRRHANAQQWNDARSRALVEQATTRRAQQLADTGLRDYKAVAHGYVTFLAQVGEGLAEPPKVVKADELVNEVYWRAPNLSKQRILGRRDTLLLPTDITYHRDHLGIVQNNFPAHHPARRRRRGARRPASALHDGPRGVRLRHHRFAAAQPARAHDRAVRGEGAPEGRPPAAHHRRRLHRPRRRAGRPHGVQLHPRGVPGQSAGRPVRHHREQPRQRALLAAAPAADRDPPRRHLARLPHSRHHPRPLGHRRLRREHRPLTRDVQRSGDRARAESPARHAALRRAHPRLASAGCPRRHRRRSAPRAGRGARARARAGAAPPAGADAVGARPLRFRTLRPSRGIRLWRRDRVALRQGLWLRAARSLRHRRSPREGEWRVVVAITPLGRARVRPERLPRSRRHPGAVAAHQLHRGPGVRLRRHRSVRRAGRRPRARGDRREGIPAPARRLARAPAATRHTRDAGVRYVSRRSFPRRRCVRCACRSPRNAPPP